MLSKGCKQCHIGAKMVLFVTGICGKDCWYCPISYERKGKDNTYANDRLVKSDRDIIDEAKMMGALGTGVTGGEALLDMDKVTRYCRLLKDEFGPEHHIHLYTGTAPSTTKLNALKGLVDEIRMHPPQEMWENILDTDYIRAAKEAKEMGFEVTIEVPSLPGLKHLIQALPYIDYLNINELEWSETNAKCMREQGYSLEDDYHNAVPGAMEWAKELLSANKKVHWCSSTFKDSVQLRERLKRIAQNTAREFDEITEDGTVVYGFWIPEDKLPDDLEENMYQEFDDHIELAWWLLSDYPDDFPGEKKIIERYPNDGMIVEVTPL
ncbi:radical SAM protein [Methanoplanus sp. FWC-SCC4]|uniref:Radical SAM protein n=1 Tax=Methanochimaera problematica TaxID=2609417 RepID=A0AA97I2Q5_9EURY|nr:radical SAM protein [Methanoplanus sp. FWC-SCC4]WOF16530.1 radical SAM protein [Methanoplanus sp. FWC-SCC4]